MWACLLSRCHSCTTKSLTSITSSCTIAKNNAPHCSGSISRHHTISESLLHSLSPCPVLCIGFWPRQYSPHPNTPTHPRFARGAEELDSEEFLRKTPVFSGFARKWGDCLPAALRASVCQLFLSASPPSLGWRGTKHWYCTYVEDQRQLFRIICQQILQNVSCFSLKSCFQL